jgi:hypothetical protein
MLALLFILSINANAGLIFSSDFEKNIVSSKSNANNAWKKQACEDKAIMPVKAGEFGAPAPRAGKYMLRSITKSKLCKGIGKIRTELIGNGVVPSNTERWIGFSTYIPKNRFSEQKPVAFFQLHYTSKGYELFNIEAEQGRYTLLNYNASKGKRERNKIASIEYDVWTDWVFHVKFTNPSSKKMGFVKIWKNGKLVYNWKGHTIRNGQKKAGTRKIGQYVHKGWPKSNPPYMVMYHDEFRAGDQNSRYNEVSPGGKKPTKDIGLPTTPTGLKVIKHEIGS